MAGGGDWERVDSGSQTTEDTVSVDTGGRVSFLTDAADKYLGGAEAVEVLAKDGKVACVPEQYANGDETHVVTYNSGCGNVSARKALAKAGVPEIPDETVRCEAEWADDHETMVVVDVAPVIEAVGGSDGTTE